MHHYRLSLVLTTLALAALSSAAAAQRPRIADLAPATTKAFFSVPDAQVLEDEFNKTEFGELVKDPVVKPFIEDLRKQLESKMSQVDSRLGITLDDMRDAASGELGLFVIQPNNDATRHAVAAMVDVAGKQPQAQQLLAKVAAEMAKRRATSTPVSVNGIQATRYLIPPAKGETRPTQAFNGIARDWLLACDDLEEFTALLKRLDRPGVESLSQLPAYAAIQPKVRVKENAAPHLSWFMEPFGYAASMRAASTKKRKPKDVAGILARQGFNSVLGLGGTANFSTQPMQLVHRTHILTASDGAAPILRDAAKMLQLPNSANLTPPTWVPAELAVCLRLNGRIKEGFPLVGPVFDAMEDQPGLFDEILDGLRSEKNGPRIDVEKDLIAFLGQRVVMITKPKEPVQVDSEHKLYAFETTDADALRRSFEPALERDPTFKRIAVEGLDIPIWRHQPKPRERRRPVRGGNNPFAPNAGGAPAQPEVAGALVIQHGFLMYATNEQFLIDVIQSKQPPLSADAEYQEVERLLSQLGAASDCLRYYTRLHRSQLVNYELLRQGKMPKSKTLLGMLLNDLLAPDEPGVERQQEVDGSKLPPFAPAIEQYLGNGGVYARTEPDGWSLTGFLLRRNRPHNQAAAASSPRLGR